MSKAIETAVRLKSFLGVIEGAENSAALYTNECLGSVRQGDHNADILRVALRCFAIYCEDMGISPEEKEKLLAEVKERSAAYVKSQRRQT
jgi:hypothetical protein